MKIADEGFHVDTWASERVVDVSSTAVSYTADVFDAKRKAHGSLHVHFLLLLMNNDQSFQWILLFFFLFVQYRHTDGDCVAVLRLAGSHGTVLQTPAQGGVLRQRGMVHLASSVHDVRHFSGTRRSHHHTRLVQVDVDHGRQRLVRRRVRSLRFRHARSIPRVHSSI